MPERWTEELDKCLLLEMYRVLGSPSLSQDQWSTVAAKLGNSFTGSSVAQRFRKQLKKLDATNGSGTRTSKASTPRTPASGKPKNGPSTTTTSGDKRKERHANFNDQDDEELGHTGAKRHRADAAGITETPIKVKDENDLDFEDYMNIKSVDEPDFFIVDNPADS